MTNSTPTTRAERESLRLSADGTVRGRSGSDTSAIILRMIADVDRLETELTEAKRVVEGLMDWAEHRRECDVRTFDSYDPAKGHYRFCNGQYEYRRPLRCTCGLDAVLARAAEWLKGATT